jgi:hypothetical protein
MKSLIRFHSKTFKNNLVKENAPKPARGYIPEWFMSKEKYLVDENNNKSIEFYKTKDGSVKFVRQRTYKSCPALLDSLSSGYVLSTPCDIEVKKDAEGYSVFVQEDFSSGVNVKNGSFSFIRGESDGFPTPSGHNPVHFVWNTNWFPEVPDGYIALFTHPLNRFDLPFTTISGIVDCSGYINGGAIPFFIKENFEGVIKAGTPFVQIIPFKNEQWEHENLFYNEEESLAHSKQMNLEYSIVDFDHDTNYKQKFWSRKKFN